MGDGEEAADATTTGECLVALAARRALPAHQYIDAATVDWIASHEDEVPGPRSVPAPTVRPAARRILRVAPLPASWHAERRVIDSIHGSRHLLRTAALAAILAERCRLNQADTETLIVAAATHDCRRVNDRDDPGHGARAADWLTECAVEVFGLFDIDLSGDRVRDTGVAMRLHEVPYAHFTHEDAMAHATAERITDLLKTADALDRYRMPKRKWWPDDRFLRLIPPPWLHRLAFDLVVETERTRLDGSDSAGAVLTALDRRGLL